MNLNKMLYQRTYNRLVWPTNRKKVSKVKIVIGALFNFIKILLSRSIKWCRLDIRLTYDSVMLAFLCFIYLYDVTIMPNKGPRSNNGNVNFLLKALFGSRLLYCGRSAFSTSRHILLLIFWEVHKLKRIKLIHFRTA